MELGKNMSETKRDISERYRRKEQKYERKPQAPGTEGETWRWVCTTDGGCGETYPPGAYVEFPYVWVTRKSHIINPATDAGTGYQVFIRVFYGSGTDSGNIVYLDGKCFGSFSDIRFADHNLAPLSYYKEDLDTYNYAYFWVKVNDNLSTFPSTIYIYYNNPSADDYDYSSADDTFFFFDSFEQDLSKWFWDPPAKGTINSNYYYRGIKSLKEGVAGYPWMGHCLLWNCIPTWNFSCEVHYYDQLASGTMEIHLFSTDGANHYEMVGVNENISSTLYVYYDAPSWYVTNILRTKGWHTFGIRNSSGAVDIMIDGAITSLAGTDRTMDDVSLKTYEYPTLSGISAYWDYVTVRRFVYPEPAHGTWGQEENLWY